MSVEIRVPALGESIVDATLSSWAKHEGDQVKQGELLAELETDKINIEVNAEQEGVLQRILKQAGETVAVGEAIGVIDEVAGASNGVASSAHEVAIAGTVSPQPTQNGSTQRESITTPLSSLDTQRPPSPLARRIAAEYKVDIAQVKGSSPHGRVTKDDVVTYLEQNTQGLAPIAPTTPTPAPASPPVDRAVVPPVTVSNGHREERVRMTRRRQTIAQRLVEAQHTAAMLTTFNEIDMSAVMDVRSRRKDAFKERHDVSLGFMSFFTKATVGALKAFPYLNAEIQGVEIVLKHYYDIGIAVSTDEGLVVPVVREADRKSFAQIEREIGDLAKKARSNTLSLVDLQGGSFTITNGGVFGSLLSTPILNGPQVGILGMHKIEQRPIAVNGQVVIRPMMYVALSYDHRIVDGSEAVRFLAMIKELVEDPEALLLEG
jgi:2-oxoglutarate dehydrogenase E2 component (dihydrolipoamide succinyltransferase)